MKRLIKSFARLHGYRISRGLLRRSERWPEERRRDYALDRLRTTLVRAANGTAYYRSVFQDAGFDPRADLGSLEDLRGLPLLTKDDVRHAGAGMVDARYRTGSIRAETSGTTGEPLRMRLNEGYVAFDSATTFRHWSWAGYRWRAPMVALRSYVPESPDEPLWRYDLAQNTLFMSAYHLTPANAGAYIDRILEFGPQFIRAYPSSMAVLAEYARPVRDRFQSLKGLFVSSETLVPTERDVIEEVFGRKVFNWYGMTEPVMVITECEAHDGMHVNWEYGHAEFLPSEDLPDDEYRLVATSYHNPVMPFIRYDTGDVVRITGASQGPCACGRTLPRVDGVVGRKDECLVTPDGRRLPSVNFYTVFRKYDEILKFQIVQYGRVEVLVLLAFRPGTGDTMGLRQRLGAELRARLGPEVELEIRVTDRFRTSADGKTPPILRRIGSRSVEELDEYVISSQRAWESHREGKPVHKLDWNEAGQVPADVRGALREALEEDEALRWYPEARSADVTTAIAEYAGVPAERVELTHGSDTGMEALATAFVRPGDAVVVVTPTYDNFRAVVAQRGAEVHRFRHEGRDAFPLERFGDLLRRTSPRLAYLTNPNNPIGYTLTGGDIGGILRLCEPLGTVLVVDEAYVEFGGLSSAHLTASTERLVVLRTFSKAFGLAGLRLGYIVASDPVIRLVRRVQNPKSVTTLAKVGALAALRGRHHMEAYVREVHAARERLTRFLNDEGLDPFPSEANFVLFRHDRAEALVGYLSDHDVLVRDRSAHFDGRGHVRVTVTGQEGVDAFLDGYRRFTEAGSRVG